MSARKVYCFSMETVYFKGEVSPYGWVKVPAYPLCGFLMAAKAAYLALALLPGNFSRSFAW
ncbi:MAG: hypothetical protein LBU19_07330 [Treponema sp.]|nr:hypothetical protein [Treponema sp.]